jgi:magnesium-transporting ATPase (P-type)
VDSIGADGAVISFAEDEKRHIASAYAKAMKTVMHNRASDTDKILQDADEAAPITAAVGRETRDSGVTAAADIGIAAARSNLRTIPTTLSANSSVIIHSERKKSAQSGFGGFDSVVRAVDSASVMFANMESAKAYLTASQCARLIVLTAAVFLGIPFLSAVFLLIWGLLFDFAAILMMAFTSPESRIGGNFRTADGKRRIGQVVSGSVWGVSVSGWCVLLPVVMRILGLGFGNGEITAILEASVILCGALYAFTSLKNTYSDAKLRIPMAGVMFFGGTAVLVLILTFADIPVIGAAFCGFGSLLALVPALVPLCMFAVEKLARSVKSSQ